MIGQALALRHPDRFRAIILSNTISRTPPEGQAMWDQRIEAIRKDGIEGQVQPTLERWLSPEFRARDPETTKWVADMIRGTPAAGMIGCARAIQKLDYAEQLGRITLPTLVIAGEKDPGAPVAAAQSDPRGDQGLAARGDSELPAPAADRGRRTQFNRIVGEFLERLG